jgi:hypothetical protein
MSWKQELLSISGRNRFIVQIDAATDLPDPRKHAATLTTPNRLIYGVCCPLPPLHQYLKANGSRLAFFIAESCVFGGVPAEACGLRLSACWPAQGPIPLSPAPSSLAPSRVKILKSASTKISLVTNQELTRGLFKRLVGVIARPEEITNLRYRSP